MADPEKGLAKLKIAEQNAANFEDYIRAVRPALKKAYKKTFNSLPTKMVLRDVKQGKKVERKKVSVIDSSNKDFDEFLLGLDDAFLSALDDIGYSEKANQYLTNFDLVEEGNLAIHEAINGKSIQPKTIAGVRRFYKVQTLSYLSGTNLANEALIKVRKTLTLAALNEASYVETVDNLADIIAGSPDTQGEFSRISTLMARDSIYQYNGLLNEEASRQFGYNAYQYIGSTVDDTRAQCERWVDAEYILFDELQAEIDWAFDNGTGMNPSTNIDNFAVYRGGYNCRHMAIPVFYEPPQE